MILQSLNLENALDRLRGHARTWEELLELLGTRDVYALHRLFRNAKSMNWSIERLLEMVKRLIDGSYHAKGYSDLELDLAVVVYELGGDAALHALHNSPFGFPCRNTLSQRRSEYKLRISVGSVRMDDLLHNIEVMFKNLEPRRQVGITLCLDEVASDGRLCWIPATDDIAGI
jgi:hypothetical protein